MSGATVPGLPLYLGLTDGRWKYIWYPEGPSEQLFDLQADPEERHDLAGVPEHAEKQREMQTILARRHEERGSKWVAGGDLVSAAPLGDDIAERRSRSWPGYHTEYHDVDVRH